MLHSSMKAVMEACISLDVLKKVPEDFSAMKRIVTNAKKSEWNSLLPFGFHLIKEVETRFGTHFIVADRFLKSSTKVWALIGSHNLDTASKWYQSLTKDKDGRFITIEAIVDAFKPICEATVEFEAAHHPCLHKVLPTLQYCRDELGKTARVDLVKRGNRVVRPSAYLMHLCTQMKAEISKIQVHDLWLLACFPYPYLRDFDRAPFSNDAFAVVKYWHARRTT